MTVSEILDFDKYDFHKTPDSLRGFYDKKYSQGREIPKSSKNFAVKLIPNHQALDVLDVGCGTGLNSLKIRESGHNVSGIDVSPEAIESYRSFGLKGVTGNIEQHIPFDSHSFDVIFCSEVLEHTLAAEEVLQNFYRVLRPDGKLIITVPNSAWWLYRLAAVIGIPCSHLQHPKHFQFFSYRSLKKNVYGAGFENIKTSGRNMYAVFPNVAKNILSPVLSRTGWTFETRFTTGKNFWHLSTYSKFLNSLFADTIILEAYKRI